MNQSRPPAPYSLEDFLARAQARLAPIPPQDCFDPTVLPGFGDYRLNPDDIHTGLLERARPAAVLIGVVARPAGAAVILTERTAHLRSHSGQVAFPGGKIDATDASPAAAALREAEEEIGLAASFIEPLGYLDPYSTGTGYRIVPVVALVSPGFTLQPNPGEVADVFEVPLSFLLEPRNYVRHTRAWQGRERAYYAVPYNERYIWGATAGMIRNLWRLMYETP